MQNGVSIQVFLSGERLVTRCACKWFHLLVNVALVHFKASLSIELAFAKIALETIFASVEKHMCLQAARLDKLLAAELTLVRFDARVYLHVAVQCSFEGKGKIALGAFEWFFTSMYPTVLIQSTTAAECLGAFIALVGALPSVSSGVNLQMARRVEQFKALFALVLFLAKVTFFRVLTNVLLEIVPASEAFVALGAGEFGRSGNTGRLEVTLQVRLAGKAFVTCRAGVLGGATVHAVVIVLCRIGSIANIPTIVIACACILLGRTSRKVILDG